MTLLIALRDSPAERLLSMRLGLSVWLDWNACGLGPVLYGVLDAHCLR